jgi:hypothetical protein
MRNRRQFARAWWTIAPQTLVVKVSGTHVSIMRTRHLKTIANDLQRRIQSLLPDPPLHLEVPADATAIPRSQ